LDLISQFKVTNLKHSKLLLKILVTHNMKNVISRKVRILGSNLFLTREYEICIRIVVVNQVELLHDQFHLKYCRLHLCN
jgi:hypothetical protein